jgi:ATP-binding cassette subfamily B protein
MFVHCCLKDSRQLCPTQLVCADGAAGHILSHGRIVVDKDWVYVASATVQVMNQESVAAAFDQSHPFRTLMRLLRPRRKRLVLAFILYGFKHSPIWLMPVVVADIIDVLVQQREVSHLYVDGAIILILLGQNLPVNIWFAMTLSKVLRELESNLRGALSERVQLLSIGFWNRMNVGTLQSKVVRDVENVELALRQAGNGGFAAIFNFVGAITITSLRVPQFLVFFLILVPVTGIVMVFTRRRLNERNEAYRAAVEHMGVRTTEMTLVPVARAHGLEETALRRVRALYDETRQAALRLDFANSSFGAVSWVVFNFANAACVLTAVWAGRTGRIEISAGEVVMLSSYFGVLASAVVMLTDLAPNFARGIASIRSIAVVLESPDLEPNLGKASVNRVEGKIEFRNVIFQYPEGEGNAVDGVSFVMQPGQMVAVAGPSGCGKSTLANLLIGFLRPTGGTVLVDDVDTATLDFRSIRSFVSVVPQESVMFEGSVRQNVAYGKDDATDDEVFAALRDANALEFVEQLPEGIETDIGPRGFTLSGGQKQRLAIARAILRNPRILVLDEATSALDSESEYLVQQALNRLMHGRTTFVIAHRLSTIKDADCIYVMEAGKVVESGTHEALLAKSGLYARLHATALES